MKNNLKLLLLIPAMVITTACNGRSKSSGKDSTKDGMIKSDVSTWKRQTESNGKKLFVSLMEKEGIHCTLEDNTISSEYDDVIANDYPSKTKAIYTYNRSLITENSNSTATDNYIEEKNIYTNIDDRVLYMHAEGQHTVSNINVEDLGCDTWMFYDSDANKAMLSIIPNQGKGGTIEYPAMDIIGTKPTHLYLTTLLDLVLDNGKEILVEDRFEYIKDSYNLTNPVANDYKSSIIVRKYDDSNVYFEVKTTASNIESINNNIKKNIKIDESISLLIMDNVFVCSDVTRSEEFVSYKLNEQTQEYEFETKRTENTLEHVEMAKNFDGYKEPQIVDNGN